jgi:tetratricopeptide (TPR) repeat protein/SH3-like domain-containing protein
MRSFFIVLLYPLILVLVTCEVSFGTEGWFEKGVSLAGSQHYDEAIDAFTKALEEDPRNAEAFNQRGFAWFLKGDYDRATEDYTAAIEIDPRFADAYNNRGAARYEKGDYDGAIADYTLALKDVISYLESESSQTPDNKPRYKDINPVFAKVYINRGSAWHHKGNYNRAVADYTTALEIQPRSARAYINRGIALSQIRDYGLAVSDYEKALEINPDSAYANNQLAWIISVCPDERYRDGMRAVQLAEKAVKLEPGAAFLATLAAAMAEAGRFGEAVEAQKRVIVLRNEKESDERLSESIERLRSYMAEKPWRLDSGVSTPRGTLLSGVATIKVPAGNIRLKPSVNAPILAKVKEGSQLRLIDRNNEWYIVELPDQRTGWAHRSLFTSTPDQLQPKGVIQEGEMASSAPDSTRKRDQESRTKLIVGVRSARVRSAPSLDSEIKYRLREGAVVTVNRKEGNWYLVEFGDGERGWAHRSLFLKSPEGHQQGHQH